MKKGIVLLIGLIYFSRIFAVDVPIYEFSIDAYSQKVTDYLPTDRDDYTKPLVYPEYQNAQMEQFYRHYFGSSAESSSPWSETMVRMILPMVQQHESNALAEYETDNKPIEQQHYAENYKPHDAVWLARLKNNMGNLDALTYQSQNNAIAINNTYARSLPDQSPDFYSLSIAGQGFPFDNLQESAIWAGTPLYVIAVSQDKAWSLVLTPDAYFSWVKSNDIAYASSEFIAQWQKAAEKNLVAITETEASMVDAQGNFQFSTYIGAVFPFYKQRGQTTLVLIPIKNKSHQAQISIGVLSQQAASLMPLPATKENMAQILKQLQNRPYGWGGAYFFNDCSQELKSIFTPFGIWLPRNSSQQAQFANTVDLSKESMEERLNTLTQAAHPLMTIIYIGGHVMLYVGNVTDSNKKLVPITYQNVWGLSPITKDKRYVIGQSLFFPLLKSYPEQADANSEANKDLFKLVYLDSLNAINKISPHQYLQLFVKSE